MGRRAHGTQVSGHHGAPGARAGASRLPDDALLREIPRLLELAAVPGLGLAVVEGGTRWVRGFGLRDQERGSPVDPDTVFEAASLGKPLFAVAVLRLRDAGVLDLDRPLASYLPLPDAGDPLAREITARHVLSHTTGLPNWRYRPGPLSPATRPGTEYSYSGEGFVWLQRVIERVTDRPFGRLMEREILRPLGMADSSYVWRPAFAGRMAAGYGDAGQRLDVYGAMGRRLEQVVERIGRPPIDWRYEDSERAHALAFPELGRLPCYLVPNAAGSLLTTPSDYARFLAHLTTGEPASLGISGSSLREMLSPQVRLNSAVSWGLGWGLEHDESAEYFWHYGANGSFRSFAIGSRGRRLAVAAFTNGAHGPKVYQRVIARITGRDHAAFLW